MSTWAASTPLTAGGSSCIVDAQGRIIGWVREVFIAEYICRLHNERECAESEREWETVGRMLQRKRRECKLSLRDAADRIGVRVLYLKECESDARTPTDAVIQKAASVYGCTVEALRV